MKKYIVSLALLSFAMGAAQHKHTKHCGFHHRQTELEKKNPHLKEAREKLDAKILSRKLKGLKSEYNVGYSVAKNYTGQVFEIPVVVHIIESSDSQNARYKLTDEQIKTWIENANKMYAGTYGGDYYPTGDGLDQSAVIPFKLVLAKRDQNCNPTSGIIRYNGSTLSGYDNSGVYSETRGATEESIVGLAPHWPESSYYNIYVVNTFDGDTTDFGLMGYAYYPQVSDSIYHTFMKVAAVTSTDDSTLAHEFGHALGLDHPFEGADSDGRACPPVTAGLTDNEACLKDNDKVCDTEPIKSLLDVFPAPSNLQINPCTNDNYKDTQFNIMHYTPSTRKFTAGQRERALDIFMNTRRSLTTSLGATVPATSSTIQVKAPQCSITIADRGEWQIGPKNVKLGDIDNMSSTNSSDYYYYDYTKNSCIANNIKTDIKEGETQTLSVELETLNPQWVKAWIDYNNDGQFSDDELIAKSTSAVTGTTFLATFTPPSTAVKNTYLRMRVGADYQDFTACSLDSGQLEDYAVRIVSDNPVVEDNTITKIYYNYNYEKLVLSDTSQAFGEFQIYDMSGRLIRSGSSTTNEIDLRGVSVGTYILKYKSKSEKFIKY